MALRSWVSRRSASWVVVMNGGTVAEVTLNTTTQEAQSIDNQLRNGMGDDLIGEYITQARQDLGVVIHQQAVRQATGGEL